MKPLHDSTTLLQLVADQVESAPAEFDMGDWGWHFSNAAGRVLVRNTNIADGCGTAMCIGGWTLQLGLTATDRAHVFNLSDVAGNLLDLRDGGLLFYATYLNAPQAASILRQLAELKPEDRTHDKVVALLQAVAPGHPDD